ncbi:MAG: D-cysteine desulfhydrase family protein [Bryobacteraceae bacterium]
MSPRTSLSLPDLDTALARFPRTTLAHLPTPLDKLPRLSRNLGIDLYCKRDDQTGLAFGGNKTRKLEFIMGDVLAQGADTVITWAGVQSNWCRQTAAAANKLGIKPVLVLFKRSGLPSEMDGNLLLDSLLGADIRMIDLESGRKMMEFESLRDILDGIADEERKAGRKPYIAPIGGSAVEASMTQPLGALGYLQAVSELQKQAAAQGFHMDVIVVATGSGGTHAGLIAGVKLLCPETKLIAISVSDDRATISRCAKRIADQALQALGENVTTTDEDVIVYDEYFGAGYGLLNRETAEVVRRVAATEGVLLDPVYTGKAMVGLLDLVRRGEIPAGSNVVFMHTGGTPALFPYRQELLV